MPLIRTSTSDLKNVELSSGYLPQGYETEDAAKAHIAEMQAMYDLSGHDDRHARWWATNSGSGEITYWWLEYPA